MAIQGIIKPPPDIRAVADKTALFVAKNGRAFETRIINSEKGKTPKFSFLNESSPFHAYYEDRIVFYENGGTDEVAGTATKTQEKIGVSSIEQGMERSMEQNTSTAGTVDGMKQDMKDTNHDGTQLKPTVESSSIISARKAKSTIDPIARALLSQRAKIGAGDTWAQTDGDIQQMNNIDDNNLKQARKEPLKLSFANIPTPLSISSTQLDIIKLTAQFAALSGKGGTFLRDLTIREWNNYPVFGFLQPRHEHFAFFSSLVDSYRRVLAGCLLTYDHVSTTESGLSVLERAVLSQSVGLDSWSEDDTIISTKADVLREQDHIRHLSGNVGNCLEDVAYRIEYDRYMTERKNQELMEESNTSGRFIGGASNIDWHDFVVVETIDFPTNEIVEVLPPPPLALPTSTKSVKLRELYQQHKTLLSRSATDDGSLMSEDDDHDADNDEEQLKIVPETEYTPKVVSTTTSLTHVIDPITKRSIPIQDMSEHMRIQLLDPKWAEERKKFLDKQKDSNFVQGDDIARNINSFAKAVMGSDDSRNDQPSALTSTGPLIPNMAFPLASAGNPLGPGVPPAFLPKAQALFMHPPPSSVNSTISLVEPFLKRPRLDDMNEMTHASSSVDVSDVSKTDNNMSGGGKDTTIVDLTETETTLSMSEADFARSLGNPDVTLQVSIPDDQSNKAWNLNGQTLNLTVNVMTKVKTIKEKLQLLLGMPINKMQLRSTAIGFLKDTTTLAYCNIGHVNPCVELVPKTRGGRK